MTIDNQGRVHFKPKQLEVLRAVGALISHREDELSNHKTISISSYAVHKKSGVAYNTCKKYLKQLKDLK